MTAEIKLKLVSGGKIILADCLGYESELFVPVIINKRIVLQNAVVSRRCCNRDFFGSGNQLEQNSSNEFLKKLSIPKVPLANSTPTKIIKPCKENVSNTIEPYPCPMKECTVIYDSPKMNLPRELTIKHLRRSQYTKIPNKVARIIPKVSANASHSGKDTLSPTNKFSTPDIVRRAAVQNANEIVSMPRCPRVTALKIVRLHRVNTPNTPKNVAKIVRSKTNTSSPPVLRNLSNVSSFGSPPSLHRTKETNSFDCATPNQSFLARRIKTPGTDTKWRKCITPKRTYIRHSNGQNTLPKTTGLQPLQLAKNVKYIDRYRLPIKLETQVIIKRRKLIIDNNLKITPRKFKKQLSNTDDLNRIKYDLPKSRTHYYFSHMTAFDLLTNSSFYPKIGKQLNSVFRQGCVNKYAATILKYKQLTTDIPILETEKESRFLFYNPEKKF